MSPLPLRITPRRWDLAELRAFFALSRKWLFFFCRSETSSAVAHGRLHQHLVAAALRLAGEESCSLANPPSNPPPSRGANPNEAKQEPKDS